MKNDHLIQRILHPHKGIKKDTHVSPKTRLMEYLSYILAVLAAFIGVASIFDQVSINGKVIDLVNISGDHEKSLLWFAFALIAILVPYIRTLVPYIQEITYGDLNIVINKLNDASQLLEGAAISVKELDNRLNDTRNELINGYQELLRLLPEKESKKRVIRLSMLYLQEMGITIKTVKEWLVELGHIMPNMEEVMDDDYLHALRKLQQSHNLGDDGIFGYRTYNLILNLREGKSVKS